MTYSEKLKDPRWQQLRLRVYERDGFACTSCLKKDKTLHVHHLFYESGKEPWEYAVDDLITLCEDCHQTTTDYMKIFQPELIKQLKQKLRDTFIQSCFLELISQTSPEQFNDLIYILWELRKSGDDTLEILRAVSRIKDFVFMSAVKQFKPELLNVELKKCQESEA